MARLEMARERWGTAAVLPGGEGDPAAMPALAPSTGHQARDLAVVRSRKLIEGLHSLRADLEAALAESF